MTERELQALVVEAARQFGWMAYHTFDSRRSQPGFPDLVLIRGDRLIAAELKVGTALPTEDQKAWLAAFGRVRSVEAVIVRDIGTGIAELVALLAPEPIPTGPILDPAQPRGGEPDA
jgi:hypothetical protein